VSGERFPTLALRLGESPATRVGLAKVQKALRERRRESIDVLQRRGRDLSEAVLARIEMRLGPYRATRLNMECGTHRNLRQATISAVPVRDWPIGGHRGRPSHRFCDRLVQVLASPEHINGHDI
jgi:hypothetical protein